MKIDNMKEFIVFSEYMNFTSAAKNLFTTQPALSYRISCMEKEIGFCLIDRAETGLRLTPAGRQFLSESQEIVHKYEKMLSQCIETSKRTEKLVFEHPAGTITAAQEFESCVSLFARTNPNVDISFSRTDGHSLKSVLLENVADGGVIFTDSCYSDDPSFRECLDLISLPSKKEIGFCAWVHESSPLATKDHLYAKDIDGCCLAMQADAYFQIARDSIKEIFKPYGVKLNYRLKTGKDGVDFLWEVKNDEILISDSGWLDLQSDTLKAIPSRILRKIEDPELIIKPHLVVLKKNANPALKAFIESLTS